MYNRVPSMSIKSLVLHKDKSCIVTIASDISEEIYTIPEEQIPQGSFPGLSLKGDVLYIGDKSIDMFNYTKTVTYLEKQESEVIVPPEMDQSTSAFIQKLLAKDPNAVVSIESQPTVKTVTAPVSSSTQQPTHHPSHITPQINKSKSQPEDESDRDYIRREFGVEPEALVVINGKSAVKSIVKPSADNNYVTQIIYSPPPPRNKIVCGRNGEFKSFRDGELVAEKGAHQTNYQNSDSQQEARSNRKP